jgi:hypothetical protein
LLFAFLAIKGVEWTEDYHEGIFLGLPALQAGHPDSKPLGEILFFGMYFTMTGLHGFHIIIGIGLCYGYLSVLMLVKLHHSTLFYILILHFTGILFTSCGYSFFHISI